MAMPSNLKDPAVAKKLFENLQSDLRALSTEGKKKHSNVKEVSTIFIIPINASLLTHCMLGNFSCFCCRLLVFSKLSFQKILSGTLSECQTVWIQIRNDILLVLIWVQTVCKGYQQMTKVTASKERELSAVAKLVRLEIEGLLVRVPMLVESLYGVLIPS